MPELTKILIANRGEIACRIQRTAQAMGYRTVAVYSEADTNAPHVAMADEAVPIGPAPVADSYLNAEKILEAARLTGADAVHPGYGFLSENAEFARAVADAGLVFIGPPPEAIALMGSKRASKRAMIAAGVPCVPGYEGEDQGDERLLAEAARIGLPVMVKASAGGGGKGMRLVDSADALPEALQAARSEALKAFGSDELILEKAVIAPRHIEIQIFADGHGNILHLGERDCSVQRRHQKVIEEAPSPFVTPELRERMGAAAIEAARACGYVGAGTVEFLTDDAGAFYFLEMNTRLQVEHPVTECVTGLDLVEWQLRVAAGEPLPLTQEQIALHGHAIEARLYAEDPRAGFLPQTGRVLDWQPPAGPGLRVDHGLAEGLAITPHYDPMLAKVIAHGRTRDEARRRLARALEDMVLLGVTANAAFLARILRHPVFADGGATTAFLERHFHDDPTVTPAPVPLPLLTLAAALLVARTGGDEMAGWHNTAAPPWPLRLRHGDTLHDLTLAAQPTGGTLRCTGRSGDRSATLELLGIDGARCTYLADGVRRDIAFARQGDRLYLAGPDGVLSIENATHAPGSGTDEAGSGRIAAPMDGAIRALSVGVGDAVARGQTVAVLEAMKMEHPLRADRDGTVREVTVQTGAQVRIRQVLIVID